MKHPLQRDLFVDWFRDATSYVHTHRDCTMVLSFGGEVLNDLSCFTALIHDIALLNGLGVKLALVPGVRPQIEACLALAGLSSRFVQGLRVTDAESLDCIKAASGIVRTDIEALLSLGVADSPMAGTRIRVISGNFVTAKPVGVVDGIDFQHTGTVRRVDVAGLRLSLQHHQVVLIPPLGYASTGDIFNLNTRDVAAEVARALEADKLIYLTAGDVMAELAADKTHFLPDEVAALLQNQMLADDHRHVLQNAEQAARNGVARIHVLDQQMNGALLSELFTREGTGMLVTATPLEQVRQATADDLPRLLKLIQPFTQADRLIQRSGEDIARDTDHFLVAERDHSLLACVALYPFPADGLGELACLAVDQLHNNAGLGAKLLDAVEHQAKAQGLRGLFVLSTKTSHWFAERGFQPATPEQLPAMRQASYDQQRCARVLIKWL
ncbi:MAG: amino-acid N-acetyltransferase [Pseudomonadota bacterium]